MADNASPQTHPSAVENIHKLCPVYHRANEHSDDDHSHHGEQDTDFPPFPLNYDGIPVNWSQVPRLQQEQYILVELRPGLPEYDKIVEEFSRMNIRVTGIERLQNIGLLERFMAEVEDLKKDRGNDSSPNIRYLYHGTNLEKKRLCENGLDQSSSTKDNMGPGLYFSTKPLKCIHYTEQPNQPDVTMILKCRVILDDDQGTPEELTEYVVHEHRRVMVEYLILFEVDDGNADLIAEEAGHDASDNEHPDRDEAADGEAVIAEEAGHDAPDDEHPDRDEAADGEAVIAEEAGHDGSDDEHHDRDEAADGEAAVIAEEAGHDAPDDEHPDREEAADGEAVIAEEAGHDASDDEHPDRDEAADGESVIAEEAGHDAPDDEHPDRDEAADREAAVIAEEAGHDASDDEHPDRDEAADREAVIAEEAGHEASDDEHPDRDEAADGERWRQLVMFIVFCSVGYIITPYLMKMVLWALGFTAQGVTKGSIAAKLQSFIGVTRGSWFATAQSTAATGFVSEWTRIIGGLFIGTIILLLNQC